MFLVVIHVIVHLGDIEVVASPFMGQSLSAIKHFLIYYI